MDLPRKKISLLAGLTLAASVLTTPLFGAVSIDYALVGNPGNANGVGGYGGVAYTYQIAKNETTIAQYAEFLNAVAKTDTYGLYSESMTTSFINGISRSGIPGNYVYTVAPGSGNKPITYVSWFDAARFTNWLQNGQPTGLQSATTTEDGAYKLNGAVSGPAVSKNPGATVWIPTENEWFKSAYYDPTKDGSGGYWLYANQSNTMTTNDLGLAGAANFYDANGYAVYTGPTSKGITDVGAYGPNSDSYYGTNDQGGNVAEWNDAASGTSQVLRGGTWLSDNTALRSTSSSTVSSSYEDFTVGFRVATVPEPTSLVLTLVAGSMMLVRRRR